MLMITKPTFRTKGRRISTQALNAKKENRHYQACYSSVAGEIMLSHGVQRLEHIHADLSQIAYGVYPDMTRAWVDRNDWPKTLGKKSPQPIS